MWAVSCITSAVMLWAASSLSGTALADAAETPIVKKAAKASKSKAKPDKISIGF